ncbi:helicase associated domain-containing protein [Streptomyces sp. NPDC001941]|uniref:helicase associated domain-containing protein n=1 Tax=Streptomyces sp. NPDC001941 TaxID=3154659 RepID=UPI003333F4D7
MQNRLAAGGSLPAAAGEVVVQGVDLGRWVRAQQNGWDGLQRAQQYLLETFLGLEPTEAVEEPVGVLRGPEAAWARNLAAARQFHAREGHLKVPRKHVEHLVGSGADAGGPGDGEAGGADDLVAIKLGQWLDNTRRRAAKLSEQRRAELAALGVPWAGGAA